MHINATYSKLLLILGLFSQLHGTPWVLFAGTLSRSQARFVSSTLYSSAHTPVLVI
jgi:hypothetical protein